MILINLKLFAALLVATPCVYGLTVDEAAQFSDDGCTPDSGNTGSEVSATVNSGLTTITSNHVPNHEWESVNPNSPAASAKTYTFTEPQLLEDDLVICLPQGPIAIAKNGVLIYNPTTSSGTNAEEDEVMDCNGGHADNQGSYHYHYLPDNKVIYDSSNTASQFIGVAFDGIPIYSVGDGISTSDLDICHGIYQDGEYRYIASEDHFPYYLGCYRAVPQTGKSATAICQGMSTGSACTCQFGVLTFSKKRTVLDLLEDILSSKKRSNPKLSFLNKRISCGGTCGVSTSGTGYGGQMPTGYGGQMPTGYGGQMPTGYGGQMPTGYGGGRQPSGQSRYKKT